MSVEESSFDEIQDQLRRQLLQYTCQAFQQLPPMTKPRILDIGCGSGVPTLELARLSGGDVTGIDIDAEALQRLESRALSSGMSDQVHAFQKSLKHLDFPDSSFDIIWAEGSIAVIGFHKGIRAWKRFLKPSGYLVVHDQAGNIDQKLKQVEASGYQLVNYFELGNEVWWIQYYEPLSKVVQQLRAIDAMDPKLMKDLERAQREIDGYHIHPEHYRSAYFIMQKKVE